MVILLDKNFYDGKEKSGIKVFEEIREKTALVYVILTSVSKLSEFDDDSLKSLINYDLFGFISFTSDYMEIVSLIRKAVDNLDLRIDAVIEEWISEKSDEERSKPYLAMYDAKVYSLNDLLLNIRKQTEFGKIVIKDILSLAIDLAMKKKHKVDA